MAKKTTPKGSANSDWKKRLAGHKQAWKKAREEKDEGGFTQIEDGTYIARATGMEVKESSQGNLGLNTEFTIIKGECAGSRTYRWDGLEREEGLVWVARYIDQLGYEVPEELDLDAIEEICKAVREDRPAFRIRLKTGETDYQNLRILKSVDVDPADDETAGGAAEGEAAAEPEVEPEAGAEPEVEAEAEGGREPMVGDACVFKYKGKDTEGVIREVGEDSCKVFVEALKGRVTVKFEDMEILTMPDEQTAEPEPEPEPEPEKPAAKKVVRKK